MLTRSTRQRVVSRSGTSRRAERTGAPDKTVGWRRPLVALLPLVCVALGGGVERWSQAPVLLVLGACLLVLPPRASMGRWINGLLVALLGLGLTAFLPARWFATPTWRAALGEDFGVNLPGTFSPQPWLSAESLVVFAAGACWFYLVATMAWKPGERRRAGALFAGGVAVLAAVFILVAKAGVSIPFWQNARHFGPFPNRNQTADFLAVGALPALALARAAWRAGRPGVAAAWLAAWSLVALAVFQCFSRGGIAILAVTTAAYLGVEFYRAMRRPPATGNEKKYAPWRRVALMASLVLVASSVFFVLGGDTLERLRPGSATAEGNAVSNVLRLHIQEDAVAMIDASPWCGVGLGNFADLFEIYRRKSADAPLRSIHPESDWLWIAAELGWPALALLAVGGGLVGRRMWPARHAHDRTLLTAAALGVAAFVAHGFFDVSAHRLGTALCGLFLGGLAWSARSESVAAGTPVTTPPSGGRWFGTVVFRGLGLVFLAAGVLWTAEAGNRVLLPGVQGVTRLKTLASQAAADRDYSTVQSATTHALDWAPLDWELYFTRAGAEVCQQRDVAAAELDFRRARFLERCAPEVPLQEARLWVEVGQVPQAVNAVLEACRRAPQRPGDFLGPVYIQRLGDARFVRRLAAAVRRDPALELALVERMVPEDAAGYLADLTAANPDLSRFDDGQKTRVFKAWASKGDPQSLAVGMAAHPLWQPLGWRWWAEARAHAATPEAWREASVIAASHALKPALLPSADNRPVAELRQEASSMPDDPTLALALCRAQHAAGDFPGALNTLTRTINRTGDSPDLLYLEAQIAGDSGQWKIAWEAWDRYLALTAANEP